MRKLGFPKWNDELTGPLMTATEVSKHRNLFWQAAAKPTDVK